MKNQIIEEMSVLLKEEPKKFTMLLESVMTNILSDYTVCEDDEIQ